MKNGFCIRSTSKGSQRRLPVSSLRNSRLLPDAQKEAQRMRRSLVWPYAARSLTSAVVMTDLRTLSSRGLHESISSMLISPNSAIRIRSSLDSSRTEACLVT